MKLSELLARDLVLLPLQAADKWQAISALAAAAVQAGKVTPKALPGVESALLERERSMTTGMEDGIAIPHAAVDAVGDVIAVLGLSPSGVPFEALDGQPARIIVCLIIPRPKKLQNIKTLAGIAKLLSRPAVRRDLLACETPEQVLAVIGEAEAG